MSEIKQTISIDRPAQVAFNFTLEPENTPKWVDGIVSEQVNERPARLGTIYRNQDTAGNWREFEVTAFEPGIMFEMTEQKSNVHVRYAFSSLGDKQCQLEYCVCIDSGELSGQFNQQTIKQILQKLKTIVESSKAHQLVRF